eukprot:gene9416-biopygen15247
MFTGELGPLGDPNPEGKGAWQPDSLSRAGSSTAALHFGHPLRRLRRRNRPSLKSGKVRTLYRESAARKSGRVEQLTVFFVHPCRGEGRRGCHPSTRVQGHAPPLMDLPGWSAAPQPTPGGVRSGARAGQRRFSLDPDHRRECPGRDHRRWVNVTSGTGGLRKDYSIFHIGVSGARLDVDHQGGRASRGAGGRARRGGLRGQAGGRDGQRHGDGDGDRPGCRVQGE